MPSASRGAGVAPNAALAYFGLAVGLSLLVQAYVPAILGAWEAKNLPAIYGQVLAPARVPGWLVAVCVASGFAVPMASAVVARVVFPGRW